jgi:hypothetical protein
MSFPSMTRKPRCAGRTRDGRRCKRKASYTDSCCVVHSEHRVLPSVFGTGKDYGGVRKRCGHTCALDERRCCACLDKRPANVITYSYPRSAVEPVVVGRTHGYCPCCRKD